MRFRVITLRARDAAFTDKPEMLRVHYTFTMQDGVLVCGTGRRVKTDTVDERLNLKHMRPLTVRALINTPFACVGVVSPFRRSHINT